ncbi:unnamed protein product [Dovyalis caffra]|uniref:Uncharacterized protein n=1 Tax=Dovyalis caffra TaxID=77055 RepID=A0AAV1RS52_9ROSI|nr:unnamed protein product [Dovyalis caffra]
MAIEEYCREELEPYPELWNHDRNDLASEVKEIGVHVIVEKPHSSKFDMSEIAKEEYCGEELELYPEIWNDNKNDLASEVKEIGVHVIVEKPYSSEESNGSGSGIMTLTSYKEQHLLPMLERGMRLIAKVEEI